MKLASSKRKGHYLVHAIYNDIQSCEHLVNDTVAFSYLVQMTMAVVNKGTAHHQMGAVFVEGTKRNTTALHIVLTGCKQRKTLQINYFAEPETCRFDLHSGHRRKQVFCK